LLCPNVTFAAIAYFVVSLPFKVKNLRSNLNFDFDKNFQIISDYFYYALPFVRVVNQVFFDEACQTVDSILKKDSLFCLNHEVFMLRCRME